MKKNRLSLKVLLIAPIVTIFVISVLLFSFLNRRDYEYLAQEQGTRILRILYENTEQELNNYLGDAYSDVRHYSDAIEESELYKNETLDDIEDITLHYSKRFINETPQITYVAYADVKNRFVGFRINPDDSLDLMRQDTTTQNNLVIYASESKDSSIVATLESYDTRVRPFLEPFIKGENIKWTDVYVNYDEEMNSTITSVYPIKNNDELIGVGVADVNLNQINYFLKENMKSDEGVIFIFDDNNHIVAHSLDFELFSVISDNPPSAEMKNILEYEDSRVVQAFEQYNNTRDKNAGFIINEGGENYYALITHFESYASLGWKIGVLLPEKAILGDILDNQNQTLTYITLLLLFGIIISVYVLNQVTKPIYPLVDYASKVAKGTFGEQLEEPKFITHEIDELIHSFNKMSIDLSKYFDEIKEKEKNLKDLNESLEETVKERTNKLNETLKEVMSLEKLASLGNLVAGISHEVNTPLGVAISANSFLEEETKEIIDKINNDEVSIDDLRDFFDSVGESTEIITTNLRRAARLVKSFKEISVNQSSEVQTLFNISHYVESILLSLKHEYKNTNHEIITKVDSDLEVYTYPGAISQILTNLILNSLRHGFEDIDHGKIDITINLHGNNLLIMYKDSGKGLTEENKKHIFDPFYTTKRGKGGSGLGMNIVYNIVKNQLNGKIDVESEINKGVQFLIEFPVIIKE